VAVLGPAPHQQRDGILGLAEAAVDECGPRLGDASREDGKLAVAVSGELEGVALPHGVSDDPEHAAVDCRDRHQGSVPGCGPLDELGKLLQDGGERRHRPPVAGGGDETGDVGQRGRISPKEAKPRQVAEGDEPNRG
jgi:hypothetical protein